MLLFSQNPALSKIYYLLAHGSHCRHVVSNIVKLITQWIVKIPRANREMCFMFRRNVTAKRLPCLRETKRVPRHETFRSVRKTMIQKPFQKSVLIPNLTRKLPEVKNQNSHSEHIGKDFSSFVCFLKSLIDPIVLFLSS